MSLSRSLAALTLKLTVTVGSQVTWWWLKMSMVSGSSLSTLRPAAYSRLSSIQPIVGISELTPSVIEAISSQCVNGCVFQVKSKLYKSVVTDAAYDLNIRK